MGHWQQIAVENRKAREARARGPRWRRWALVLLTAVAMATAWLVVLAPIWQRLL